MFNKKECKRCQEKVSGKYEFCPHCGYGLKGGSRKEEDWGMLGKDDGLNDFNQFADSMLGGIGGKMLNKMLGSAMKMLEKEMRGEMNRVSSGPRTNVKLMINGKEINLNNLENGKPVEKQVKKTKGISGKSFSSDNLKKFSKLPREEPSTNIRRLSNKVIYEINMKGVKSVEDIAITKLENSIEIKAIAKDKAYFKLISIGSPIIDYSLSKGKLVLELGV